MSRPYLLTIDPEIYDEPKRIEREIDFLVRAKLWKDRSRDYYSCAI